MSSSGNHRRDATEPARPFQFGLRQLLGAVALFCVGAATVSWRDINLPYVPEVFLLLTLCLIGYGILGNRWSILFAGLFLLGVIILRLAANVPVIRDREDSVLTTVPIRVHVVDAMLRPVPGAVVRLESMPSNVCTVEVDSAGHTTITGSYYTEMRGRGGTHSGSARLHVSAPGFIDSETNLELPDEIDPINPIVVKLDKR